MIQLPTLILLYTNHNKPYTKYGLDLDLLFMEYHGRELLHAVFLFFGTLYVEVAELTWN
jgi:hypothetical protein